MKKHPWIRCKINRSGVIEFNRTLVVSATDQLDVRLYTDKTGVLRAYVRVRNTTFLQELRESFTGVCKGCGITYPLKERDFGYCTERCYHQSLENKEVTNESN